MFINELNDYVLKNEKIIILLVEKRSILSEYTKTVLKNVINSFPKISFEVIDVNYENFLKPLPAILFYEKNKLINYLWGFHTTKYYSEWLNKNITRWLICHLVFKFIK